MQFRDGAHVSFPSSDPLVAICSLFPLSEGDNACVQQNYESQCMYSSGMDFSQTY